jgi:hypothetical protein
MHMPDTEEKLLQQIADSVERREDIDASILISATQPYILDYKKRKHIFCYSANSLTLTLEDIGTIAIPANEWTEISFVAGMKITAQSQATPVLLLVRCTDQIIFSTGTAASVGANVNVATIAGVVPGLDNTNELRVSTYGKNAAAGDTPVLLNAAGQQQAQIIDSAGTNKLAIDASGRLTIIPNTAINVAQIAGVAPGLDNTNELRVSNYGKNAAAGDTPILLDSAGRGQNQIIDSGGTNKLAIDASGRLTLIPNSSINVAQIAGVAPGLDNTNELRVSNYGKNAAAGDTPILLDSSGRMQDNIVQWGGVAPSVSNPVIIEDQLRAWIIAAQGFTATTGFSTAVASTVGASLFNPNASGKTLYVYSLRVGMNGSLRYTVQVGITADPALASSAVVTNNKNGGGSSIVSATYANATTSFATGSTADNVIVSGNTTIEALFTGQILVVPANSGIGVLLPSASDLWCVNFKWIEL